MASASDSSARGSTDAPTSSSVGPTRTTKIRACDRCRQRKHKCGESLIHTPQLLRAGPDAGVLLQTRSCLAPRVETRTQSASSPPSPKNAAQDHGTFPGHLLPRGRADSPPSPLSPHCLHLHLQRTARHDPARTTTRAPRAAPRFDPSQRVRERPLRGRAPGDSSGGARKVGICFLRYARGRGWTRTREEGELGVGGVRCGGEDGERRGGAGGDPGVRVWRSLLGCPASVPTLKPVWRDSIAAYFASGFDNRTTGCGEFEEELDLPVRSFVLLPRSHCADLPPFAATRKESSDLSVPRGPSRPSQTSSSHTDFLAAVSPSSASSKSSKTATSPSPTPLERVPRTSTISRRCRSGTGGRRELRWGVRRWGMGCGRGWRRSCQRS